MPISAMRTSDAYPTRQRRRAWIIYACKLAKTRARASGGAYCSNACKTADTNDYDDLAWADQWAVVRSDGNAAAAVVAAVGQGSAVGDIRATQEEAGSPTRAGCA